MKFSLMLCILLSFLDKSYSSNDWEDMDIPSAPYMVSVFVNDEFKGGGFIVSEQFVMTKSFVTGPLQTFSVRAGSNYTNSGGEMFEVESFISRQMGPSNVFFYICALLKLKKRLTFGLYFGLARFDAGEADLDCNYYISGWGQDQPSDQLRRKVVTIGKPENKCQAYKFFDMTMYCVEESLLGKLSLGSPLARNNSEVYGILITIFDDYAIFGRMTSLSEWIDSVIDEESRNTTPSQRKGSASSNYEFYKKFRLVIIINFIIVIRIF